MVRAKSSAIISADAQLKSLVELLLAAQHMPALRHLTVEAESGTVTVRGLVRSFYEKQLCHQCCRQVAGLVRYIDAIDVARPAPLVSAA